MGSCMRMRVRGRVLVTKVSENSRKWLRERGRVISRVCVREKTPRERVCEHVSETPDGYTPCERMCEIES